MRCNLRIFTRIFQPKIRRKIKIFSLNWRSNIPIKRVYFYRFLRPQLTSWTIHVCSRVLTLKTPTCSNGSPQNADHGDCRACRPCRLYRRSTFFLFSFLHLILTRIFLGSGHKLVFNYILLCVVDFATETPFCPKYAQVKLF